MCKTWSECVPKNSCLPNAFDANLTALTSIQKQKQIHTSHTLMHTSFLINQQGPGSGSTSISQRDHIYNITIYYAPSWRWIHFYKIIISKLMQDYIHTINILYRETDGPHLFRSRVLFLVRSPFVPPFNLLIVRQSIMMKALRSIHIAFYE